MIKSKFSIQFHHGSRPGSGNHWDFRIMMPNGKVWSWAIPKRKFPEKKDKVLAVWVDDSHKPKHMTFQGFLKSGEEVELFDYGDIIFLNDPETKPVPNDTMTFQLNGSEITGIFHMIKIGNNWLLLRSQ